MPDNTGSFLFASVSRAGREKVRYGGTSTIDHCPGAANIRTPTLEIRKCPRCGEEIEIFSNDASVRCSRCGYVVYNDAASCIRWCRHAKECLGDEMYEKLVQQKKP